MEGKFTFEQTNQEGIREDNMSWVDFKGWQNEGKSIPCVSRGLGVRKTGKIDRASDSDRVEKRHMGKWGWKFGLQTD